MQRRGSRDVRKNRKGGGGGWMRGRQRASERHLCGRSIFSSGAATRTFLSPEESEQTWTSFSWTHNFSLLRLLRQLLCAFGATASSRFGEKWLIEVSQSNSSGLFQCLNVIWGKSSILVIFFTCTLLVIFYVLYLTPCWEVYFIQLLRFFIRPERSVGD